LSLCDAALLLTFSDEQQGGVVDEDQQISTELQGLFLDMLIQCIENLREHVEVPPR